MENIEIHMLVCKKDLSMGLNCIKSLFKNKEFDQVPVFFHEDGSLDAGDIELLKKTINNSFVIEKKYADEIIRSYLSKYPFCEKYRFGKKSDIYLWHKIKTFDYFLLSKTKRVLGLDSDLLFVNKPEEVIHLVQENIPFYFPDVQSAYSFNEPKNEIPVLENVNTGLIFIPGEEYYNIESIENALSNLIRDEINYFPSWIEQSAFAHMFYMDGRYKSLNKSKNRIPFFQEVDIKKSECLHFVSYPDVRKLYNSYVSKMNFKENSKKIYEKTIEVEYDFKKIPLEIETYEDDLFLNFEFKWCIESVGINALSHQFKIKTPEEETLYEFGSNKYGFFIIKKPVDKIEIYHTYEWYGKKDWRKIEFL